MRNENLSVESTWAFTASCWQLLNLSALQAHFEDSSFEQNRKDNWKKLTRNAIPTLFPFRPKYIYIDNIINVWLQVVDLCLPYLSLSGPLEGRENICRISPEAWVGYIRRNGGRRGKERGRKGVMYNGVDSTELNISWRWQLRLLKADVSMPHI